MIIETGINGVVSKGLTGSKKFTMKASAKAFKIISKSLYSNPIGAVVRELSTNAYDAHVMNGNADIPFEITLPSTLNPEFKIRDFGTGLSLEQIDVVYKTFFESTKTDSNDVVGCLGLGSKSPFGISDSFFVTTYFDGMKTTFMAFIDEDDEPSLSDPLLHEFTDEPSGMEIQIAVKKEDIRTFAEETRNQLRHFTVKPSILGDEHFYWLEDTIDYVIGETKISRNFRNSFAVQGQIAYPVDYYMIRDKFTDEERNNSLIDPMRLLNNHVALNFKIGSIDIAPSREALSYDERTINAIKQKAIEVASEIESYIIEQINTSVCVVDAKRKWIAFKNSLNVINTDMIGKVCTVYNISEDRIYISQNDFIDVKKYYRTSRTVKNIGCVDYNTMKYSFNVWNNTTKIVLVPEKKKSGTIALLKQITLKYDTVYSITTDKSVDHVKQLFDSKVLEVHELSDFEHLRPVKEKLPSIPKPKNQVKSLSRTSYETKSSCWGVSNIDLTDQDYYVEIKRDSVIINGVPYHPEYLIKFINVLRSRNLFDGLVYGLNSEQIKTTKARSFIEFTKEFVNNNSKLGVSSTQLFDYNREYKISESSMFKEIQEYSKMYRNNIYSSYDVNTWINKCGLTPKTEESEELSQIMERYSIIHECGIYPGNISSISKLIEMIDFYHDKKHQ